MTFTYDLTSGFTDVARVRFHLGDTNSAAARFSDEEIEAVITEAGGWEEAVIYCLESLMAKLSDPDFSADWLTVNHASARKGIEAVLKLKRRLFGINAISASAGHVYRADSYATEAPTYPDDAYGVDDEDDCL